MFGSGNLAVIIKWERKDVDLSASRPIQIGKFGNSVQTLIRWEPSNRFYSTYLSLVFTEQRGTSRSSDVRLRLSPSDITCMSLTEYSGMRSESRFVMGPR